MPARPLSADRPSAALQRRALLVAGLALPALPARAQQARPGVVRLSEGQFRAGAGRITFSEVPRGTRNPVYTPEMYGGRPNDPTVRFGGYLLGRRLGGFGECPRGAAATGCLAGTPRMPLQIDPDAPPAFTAFDDTPSIRDVQISGSPLWNGPIAILFSRDIAGVGLLGGWFDAAGGTAITVYDRQGMSLGRAENRTEGREFLALATADLGQRIAALEFHLVGREPGGFGIDNIRFGDSEQVDVPGVTPPRPPEPQRAPPPPPPPPLPPLPPLLL
ncbi:MAG: PEP-CTERM sorting domain-containing protein [Roseomonas sp.]|nr:PEP-CTERM sorting domain-containing protein [Roseomonas sp.]